MPLKGVSRNLLCIFLIVFQFYSMNIRLVLGNHLYSSLYLKKCNFEANTRWIIQWEFWNPFAIFIYKFKHENPFSQECNLPFELKNSSDLVIDLYDLLACKAWRLLSDIFSFVLQYCKINFNLDLLILRDSPYYIKKYVFFSKLSKIEFRNQKIFEISIK